MVILGARLEKQLIGIENIQYHLACHINIVTIAYCNSPFQSTGSLSRVVVDGASREAAVRNYYRLVIIGGDDGVENLYLLHSALVGLKLNVVAHPVRLQQQYEHTAGKILQRAAECHTNGDSCRGKDGDERTRLDAHDADNDNGKNEEECYLEQAKQERGERTVNITAHHYRTQQVVCLDD